MQNNFHVSVDDHNLSIDLNKPEDTTLQKVTTIQLRNGKLICPQLWPHNFAICSWPQLKLYYNYFYYDLGLRAVSGASRRKLSPNLAPMPTQHASYSISHLQAQALHCDWTVTVY